MASPPPRAAKPRNRVKFTRQCGEKGQLARAFLALRIFTQQPPRNAAEMQKTRFGEKEIDETVPGSDLNLQTKPLAFAHNSEGVMKKQNKQKTERPSPPCAGCFYRARCWNSLPTFSMPVDLHRKIHQLAERKKPYKNIVSVRFKERGQSFHMSENGAF